MRIPFLVGERIYLRPLDESDITEENIEWLNDTETTRFLEMTGAFPATYDTMKQWLEKYENSTTNLAFALVHKSTDRHIGNIALTDINWIHRTAVISLLIGVKEFWGKGYGTESQSLIIDYAFNRLGVRKMHSNPIVSNIPSVKIAEKLGFQLEGVMRKDIFLEGEYHDKLRMGMFPNEFQKFRLNQKDSAQE